MKRQIWIFLSVLGLLSLGGCLLLRMGQDRVSYNRDIRPILNRNCLSCHGGVKQSGGFSLLFPEEALAETESGQPAILPGDAKNSELVRRLYHSDPELRMPYQAEPLPPDEIALIETWIDQGAQFETHWAYVPPRKDLQPPNAQLPGWNRNEVDAFILEKLQALELTPNPEADKAALLRRLSLDLIGLPPTPSEMEAFVTDSSETAYEQAVDRLLASPQFGEKWASHWLDLARYADSKGYEKDLYRSIWKYRDWVIQAWNEDMPFDQFTLEQLAGDLLPHPTESQYLATAFHRNTTANDEGGTNNEEFRNAAIIERVGTTFEVWQATTMACVQCHSHPYDPIRHEEFYEVMAFFNNTEDRDLYRETPNLWTYEGEKREEVEELLTWFDKHLQPEDHIQRDTFLAVQVKNLRDQLDDTHIEAEFFAESSRFIELTPPRQHSLFQIQDTSWVRYEEVDLSEIEAVTYRYSSPFSGFIEMRLGSPHGRLISRVQVPASASIKDKNRWESWTDLRAEVEPTQGKQNLFLVFHQDKHQEQELLRLDWFRLHKREPRLNNYGPEVRQKLEELAAIEAIPTPIMRDLPPHKRRKNYLFERGNWLAHGPEVQPGLPDHLPIELEQDSLSRLELAKWIVHPDNPLTARVFVNRIWEQLFGNGIIETVEDFGTQAADPSHPELLDWLAVQFQTTDQWHIKALLKRLVMSATYRQASSVSDTQLAVDARNVYLSRAPRLRLSAEQIRDQILAVSGLLNPKMLGPSVSPPLPEGVGRFGFGDKWFLSDSADHYRRSLYTYLKRTIPFPNQITFDGTDRTVCTSRRIRTNTPLQALALLNDDLVKEASVALAKGMLAAEETSGIANGYYRVMLRPISAEKLQTFQRFYQEYLLHFQAHPEELAELLPHESEPNPELGALTLVANSLLNLDEFLTK